MALLISQEARRYFGYFDGADQKVPAYDPGPDAACPICNRVLAGEDVRTTSIMYPDARNLSCFYRKHTHCANQLTVAAADTLEHRLLSLLGTSD